MAEGVRWRVAVVTAIREVARRIEAALPPNRFDVVAIRDFFRAIDLVSSQRIDVLIADRAIRGGRPETLFRKLADRGEVKTRRVLLMHDSSSVPIEKSRDELAHAVLVYPLGLGELAPMITGLLRSQYDELPENGRRPAISRPNMQAIRAISSAELAAVQHGGRDESEPGTAASEDPDSTVEVDFDRHVRRRSSLLAPAPDLAAFIAEIEERHDLLSQQSYFEILDVPRDIGADALREVFDAASLRFHPDRNGAIRQRTLRRKLEMLYATICEAYDVLSSQRRAAYEEALSKGRLRLAHKRAERPRKLHELSDVAGAKRFLRLAATARRSGELRGAIMNLELAIGMDPDNPQLDATLREWQDELD